MTTDVSSGVVYQTFGTVPMTTRTEAEGMMKRLADAAPRPVLYAKVKVSSSAERDPGQRFVVQGTMDVSGGVLRAQAAASSAGEALKTVEGRLQRRVKRLAEQRRDSSNRPPSTPPGTWRSGDLRERRPHYFDRPAEQRMVVRRKTFSPAHQIPIRDALFDLEVLDYRFHLFIDDADQKPTVVYEEDDGTGIRKVDGSVPDEDALPIDMTVNETPISRFTVSEAVDSLNVSGTPFLFFLDTERSRASVLYRRYDGHYGLIVAPAHVAG
jgi:ribosome-associated translation inhibitor RaiA